MIQAARIPITRVYTWSDAVPEHAWEPEGDANLNDPEDEVVGVSAAQVNPER